MAGKRNRKRSEKKTGIFYDYSMLFLVIFLIFFGLIMLYSTSYYSASIHQNDGMYYLKRQGSFAILGIAVMLLVSKIDYRFLLKKIPKTNLYWPGMLLFVSILLQIYVLIAGEDINGAKRWISIAGVITFQPSDFAKIAIIIYTAYNIYLNPRLLDKVGGFIRIAIPVGVDIILIAAENLSTAIVITLVFGGMCFIASRNKRYFVFAIILAVIAGVLFIRFGEGFRMSRVIAWKNVETDSKAYQILQGLYAIASGGMFGKGLGNSMQKLGYVPEAQNDMIFTIICEELGVFGACCVMLLFILLLCRIFQIAVNSPDLFGGMLCVGVLIHVAAQVLLNIAVVTNTIPSTGVALPFISYGGTSLAVLLMEMGFVLSVSNRVTI
ncbi:cell cycle protein [Clostridium sp. CAG:411]|jgi:cell division protein FtsW|nr:FtsW/RodA/SpoVE family cell cycle protein [Lachnospiraceae bacterium]CDE44104.1 cell cycle protein [Clostridium sp. CAG:411]